MSEFDERLDAAREPLMAALKSVGATEITVTYTYEGEAWYPSVEAPKLIDLSGPAPSAISEDWYDGGDPSETLEKFIELFTELAVIAYHGGTIQSVGTLLIDVVKNRIELDHDEWAPQNYVDEF